MLAPASSVRLRERSRRSRRCFFSAATGQTRTPDRRVPGATVLIPRWPGTASKPLCELCARLQLRELGGRLTRAPCMRLLRAVVLSLIGSAPCAYPRCGSKRDCRCKTPTLLPETMTGGWMLVAGCPSVACAPRRRGAPPAARREPPSGRAGGLRPGVTLRLEGGGTKLTLREAVLLASGVVLLESSLARSFGRSFVGSFAQSFFRSSARSFVRSFVRSLVPSLALSFARSFV